MLIGKRLHSYLAYAVLGRKGPGSSDVSTPKRRRGPPRADAYKAWIRSLPCVGCGREGCSEAAHTGDDGGMAMKASDYSCVPLCADCHRLGPVAYHRVGKRAFEAARQLSFEDKVSSLNQRWQEECA